jgi:hypothetical protein
MEGYTVFEELKAPRSTSKQYTCSKKKIAVMTGHGETDM